MITRKASVILWVVCILFLWAVAGQAADNICYQCHDRSTYVKPEVHQPVSVGKCTACHNPHAARYKGMLSYKTDKLCYTCHRREAASFLKGRVHQPVRQGECLACHDPHGSVGKGLIKGRLADRCFTCHDKLQTKYKYMHRPFADGDCITCHAPHTADNNLFLNSSPEKICLSCHTRSKVEQVHANYPVEIKGCLSCHDPHGSERQAMIRDILHEPYVTGCKECHEKGKATVATETCLGCHPEIGEQVASIHNHLTAGTGNSCIHCHTPHAGDNAGLLKAKKRQVCRSCHEDTFARYEDKAHIHPGLNDACHKCHAVHGSNEQALLKGDGNVICSQCHESQGEFSHPVGDKVIDPRNGQNMTCVSCHNPHGTDFKGQLVGNGQKALCIQCHHM